MPTSPKSAPSRLTLAWLGLGIVISVFVVAVLLTPPPPAEAPLHVVRLDGEPDRYAIGQGEIEEPIAIVAADDRTGDEIGDRGPMMAGRSQDEWSDDRPQGAATDNGADDGVDPRQGGEAGDDDPDTIVARLDEDLPAGAVRIIVPETLRGPADAATGAGGAVKASPPRPVQTALLGANQHGQHPTVSADGTTPLETYRRRADAAGRPAVAVIVGGLGIDRALTLKAIEELPADVSLAFAPYARNLGSLTRAAMADGHEVLIEVPMEQAGVPDAVLGTAALSRGRAPAANLERLDWIMARAPAYAMLTNYLGRSFSGDPAALEPILKAAKAHGLGYIDDTGLAGPAAQTAGLPHGAVSVLVPVGAGQVGARLDALVGEATPGAVRVAKVYVSEGAISALKSWTASLNGTGVVLVPASTVLGGV